MGYVLKEQDTKYKLSNAELAGIRMAELYPALSRLQSDDLNRIIQSISNREYMSPNVIKKHEQRLRQCEKDLGIVNSISEKLSLGNDVLNYSESMQGVSSLKEALSGYKEYLSDFTEKEYNEYIWTQKYKDKKWEELNTAIHRLSNQVGNKNEVEFIKSLKNGYTDAETYNKVVELNSRTLDDVRAEYEKIKHKKNSILGYRGAIEELEKIQTNAVEKLWVKAGISYTDEDIQREIDSTPAIIQYKEIIAHNLEGYNSFEELESECDFLDNYISNRKDNEKKVKIAQDAYSDEKFKDISEKGKKNYDKPKYVEDWEYDVLSYLYEKEQDETAKEFIGYLKLKERKAREKFEKIKGNILLEYLYAIPVGLEQFGNGIKSLFTAEANKEPTTLQYLSGMIRQDLSDKGPKILNNSLGVWGYDLLTTAANVLPSIGASVLAEAICPGSGVYVASVLMGASASGNAYQEKLNLGWAKHNARFYSILIGVSEAGLSAAFSGITGMKGKITGNASRAIATGMDQAAKLTVVKFGTDVVSEGIEEAAQSFLEPFFENISLGYAKNDLSDIDWQAIAYDGAMGALSAFGLNSASIGVNRAVDTTVYKHLGAEIKKNSGEQIVFDLLPLSKIGEKSYNIYNDFKRENVTVKNVTDVQLGKAYKAINEDTVKCLNTPGITDAQRQRAIVSNTLLSYAIKKDQTKANGLFGYLNSLSKNHNTSEDFNSGNNLYSDVAKSAKNAEHSLNMNEVSNGFSKSSSMEDSFYVNLSEIKEAHSEIYQKAMESGLFNNSNETHEFIKFIAQISEDKNIDFNFTDGVQHKSSYFNTSKKTADGYATQNGLTVNIDSSDFLNNIIGHEITYVLNNSDIYDDLQKIVFEYAKLKGNFESRYNNIKEKYKGTEVDIEAELTADLVGEYLFNDNEFVNKLSIEHRELFKKIFEEIKYLCEIVSSDSAEAIQLEKIKKSFEDANQLEDQDTGIQKNTGSDFRAEDVSRESKVSGQEQFTLYEDDGKSNGFTINSKKDNGSSYSTERKENSDTVKSLTDKEIDSVTEIGKRLGIKLVFEDLRSVDENGNTISPEGYIDKSNRSIHINLYAKQPINFIFKHELAHFSERSLNYNQFANAVTNSKTYGDWVKEKTEIDDLITAEETYRDMVFKSHPELNDLPAKEQRRRIELEVVADFVGDCLFTDSGSNVVAIVNEVSVRKRPIVFQYLIDFISYIKKKLLGQGFITLELSMLEDSFNRMLSEIADNTDIEDSNAVQGYDNIKSQEEFVDEIVRKSEEIVSRKGDESAYSVLKNKDIEYSFVVCNDERFLKEAERMERKGASPEQIYRKIHMIKNPRGEWLFALCITGIRLYPLANQGSKQGIERYTENNGKLSTLLKNVFVFPQLFKIHPELNYYKFVFTPEIDGLSYFDPKKNSIYINTSLLELKGEKQKNAIMVELLKQVQLAIQKIEGRYQDESLYYWKEEERNGRIKEKDSTGRTLTANEMFEKGLAYKEMYEAGKKFEIDQALREREWGRVEEFSDFNPRFENDGRVEDRFTKKYVYRDYVTKNRKIQKKVDPKYDRNNYGLPSFNGYVAFLDIERQKKYIPKTKYYTSNEKVISRNIKNCEQLLRNNAATGKKLNRNSELVHFKEKGINDDWTGAVLGSVCSEHTGKRYTTEWGIIHYSKNGAYIEPCLDPELIDIPKREIEDADLEQMKTALKDVTGWSDTTISYFNSIFEAQAYKEFGLKEYVINNRPYLIRTDFEFDYRNSEDGKTNKEVIGGDRSPYDRITGEKFELHHIGQKDSSPIAMLTENQHRSSEGNAIFHTNKKASEINRQKYKKIKKNFWKDFPIIKEKRYTGNDKNIVEAVDRILNVKTSKPASPAEISFAEYQLSLEFAKEYKKYLSTFGSASGPGFKLTGVAEDEANVVKLTKEIREMKKMKIPRHMYVIRADITDSTYVLQDRDGCIYVAWPNYNPKKIYDSLKDYLLEEFVAK